MTTELEREFFKAFGIKQKCKRDKIVCAGRASNKCPTCQNNIYPEITDRKLLKMICILSAYNYIFADLKADDFEQLKEEIIKLFLDYPFIAEEEKANIQQLFKEEE